MNKQSGFTLIELMTGLLVVGILFTVGIPAFSATIKNNRLAGEVNRFVAHLQIARSEAIKRGQPVNICRSNNAATCGGAQKTYHDGWLLYTSSARDTNYVAGTDELLQIGDAATTNISIRSNAPGNQWLSFSPSGFLDEDSAAQYVFCADGESTAAVPGRLLTISISGYQRLTELAAGASCTL